MYNIKYTCLLGKKWLADQQEIAELAVLKRQNGSTERRTWQRVVRQAIGGRAMRLIDADALLNALNT